MATKTIEVCDRCGTRPRKTVLARYRLKLQLLAEEVEDYGVDAAYSDDALLCEQCLSRAVKFCRRAFEFEPPQEVPTA